jgi:hypothetical protein
MKMTAATGPSLMLAALVGWSPPGAAAANEGPAAAMTPTPYRQLAAAGNRLTGPQIRRLLSGHTARMQRRHGVRTLRISLSFRADGTLRHVCKSQHVNVRAQRNLAPICRTPRARGNWDVRGNKLCVTVGHRRCYLVIRHGGGYVFRSPSGKGRPYAGRVSVQ